MVHVLEQKEKFQGRVFLIDLVRRVGDFFLSENITLDTIEAGNLSKEEWKKFAAQRYLAALSFEGLLESCRDLAASQEDEQLVIVLDTNLRDEKGIDAHGQENSELAHGTWRKDFYIAFGIENNSLDTLPVARGALEYQKVIRELIAGRDLLMIAGAILVLEGTIPREFARMKIGRDISFPEAFVDQDGDTLEIKKNKARARLYLDDHIVHDAKSHYPDLLRVLEKYAIQEEYRIRIEAGAQKIAQAKQYFYDNYRA